MKPPLVNVHIAEIDCNANVVLFAIHILLPLKILIDFFGIAIPLKKHIFACTSGRCNRQSEFTLLHFTIFH